jgi:hypothetical protein
MRLLFIAIVASSRLLDVPFVPQSEALCGGAAVSMVMRYWSAQTEVYAEDFAALVDERAGGISVGALARAVGERGWQAHSFAATAADVQTHIGEGRPVIALIDPFDSRALAQGKPRLHYVVIVAWTNDRVVFHDPAANPFRSMDVAAFDRVWRATGRTTLLVLPPLARAMGAGPVAETASCDRTPCHGACPQCGNPVRTSAGRLFLDRRYGDAATLAQLAVEANPDDDGGWQLLAASRFLAGDADGALDAWNRRQEPRVDLARIDGLSRTRYDVVAGLLNLPPRTVLSNDALTRAERRVASVPSIQLSRVSYSPRENGTANIDVAVVERALIPSARADILATAVHGATMREAKVNIASPSGNGEVWTASARWWSGRPRVALSLALPTLAKWSGLWQLEGAWERQTYASGTGQLESERRHAAIGFGDWRSANTRYQLGVALDRWNDAATYVSIAGDIERRLADDHVAITAASSASAGFATGLVMARWRSSRDVLAGWHSTAGVSAVTRRAPLDLRPGGDTGVVRATLLRAHPLLEDGAIRTSALRTVLPHASVEYRRRLSAHPLMQLGWSAFADAADSQLDLGVGVRVKIPGAASLLRVDVARGVRDGATALSLSWQPLW